MDDFISPFLYLTPTGRYKDGFRVFDLSLHNDEGKKVDSVAVLSGAASTQYSALVRPEKDYSKSGRCLPEGNYKLGELEDAGSGKSWGEGIGRYWVSVDAIDPVNDRSDFGIHDDENREYSQGSLGCVCPFSSNQMGRIIGWFKQQSRPLNLICNLNTGWLKENGVAYPQAIADPTPQPAQDGYEMGSKFIRSKESCELEAYPDPGTLGDPWTIGWGNTRWPDYSPVQEGDRLTSQKEADELFDFWLKKDWLYLKTEVPDWQRMTPGQQAALLSLCQNSGWRIGDGRHDTLDKAILATDWKAVPSALALYVNPGTRVEAGLKIRREQEIAMWKG